MTQLPDPDEQTPAPAPSTDGLASVVLIDRRDDVAGVCGRIDGAPTFAVVIHAPDGNRQLATQLGMRRLVRHAEDTGRVIAIATKSRGLTARARGAGVPVSRRPEKIRWDAGGRRVFWLGPASLALPGLGRYAQFGLLAAALLVAGAAALTVGPSVDIVASPPMDERTTTLVITGSTDTTEADYDALELPARPVVTTRTITLAQKTTGVVQAPVGRATVLVTLANTSSEEITIPEGALLLSSDGAIEFRMDQETDVPAGKSVLQQASALELGPSGNVAAGALTRWESDLYDEVAVTNAEAATGGTSEERPGVTEADVAAVGALAASLAESAEWRRELSAQGGSDAIFARTADVEVTLGSPSPGIGEAGSIVFVDVEVRISALAIPQEVVEELAMRQFAREPAGRLVPGTVSAVETGRLQEDGADSYSSEFRLSAGFSEVSRDEVRDSVKGKSPEDARSTLLERYGIQDADVDLVPGFMPWLPRFDFRIDVAFQEPEKEPAGTPSTADAEPTSTTTPDATETPRP